MLLRRPRPVLRLDYRLDVLPDLAMYARAITAAERAQVRDADDGGWGPALLALSLVDAAGAPVFSHPEQTHSLYDHEVAALVHAVRTAHHIVSPSYETCDFPAWETALKKGAADPGSFAMTLQVRAAFELTRIPKAPTRPRLDRYFGVPLADITDGQRMAFLAAFHEGHS